MISWRKIAIMIYEEVLSIFDFHFLCNDVRKQLSSLRNKDIILLNRTIIKIVLNLTHPSVTNELRERGRSLKILEEGRKGFKDDSIERAFGSLSRSKVTKEWKGIRIISGSFFFYKFVPLHYMRFRYSCRCDEFNDLG